MTVASREDALEESIEGTATMIARKRDGAPATQGAAHAWRRAEPQGARVIELFGPAAAGKSTLARALAVAFEERNIPVNVVASARPAEQVRRHDGSWSGTPSLLHAPLARALKLFDALGALRPGAPVDPLVAELMAILPPGEWIRALRARRYLAQLCRTWRATRTSRGVVIFDQGFVTLLSSLALRAGPINEHALARGLALVPQPDLLVRLDPSRDVIEARLEKRLSRQSALERIFENRIAVSLRQIDLSVKLDALLAEQGRPAMRVSWRDRAQIPCIATRIVDEVFPRGGGGLA
jgi:thymidylate kinase